MLFDIVYFADVRKAKNAMFPIAVTGMHNIT